MHMNFTCNMRACKESEDEYIYRAYFNNSGQNLYLSSLFGRRPVVD